MLSRVKLPYSEIREAILSMNLTIITENLVKQFLQFIPSGDEIAIISDYINHNNPSISIQADRIKDLGKVEQFFYEVGDQFIGKTQQSTLVPVLISICVKDVQDIKISTALAINLFHDPIS